MDPENICQALATVPEIPPLGNHSVGPDLKIFSDTENPTQLIYH